MIPEVSNQESIIRAGVYICNCGGEISDTLDTGVLIKKASGLTGVVHVACESYPCSKDGRARLAQAIVDHKLDRVLIAGCTPRLVEKLFQQTVEEAGLNRSYLDITDIREQCAYVHESEPAAAMQKAGDLIEMGVGRLAAVSPPHKFSGDIVRSVLVIGSGLAGLTSAHSLATRGIDVTIIDPESELGGSLHLIQEHGRELVVEHVDAVLAHPRIDTLLNARVEEVSGKPGNYNVRITHGDNVSDIAVGAIIVATSALAKDLGADHWVDLSIVMTQAEFENELEAAIKSDGTLELDDIVIILHAEDGEGDRSSRVRSTTAIQQAMRAKQIKPDANLSILFQDLFLSEADNKDRSQLVEARKLGVRFYRYSKDHPPVIGEKNIEIDDLLTHMSVKIPFDHVVQTTPLLPHDNARALAAMLKIPQDENGFMIDRRVRLRPEYHTDDGIYVVGGAHQPCDVEEELFQSHVSSARILRFFSRDIEVVGTPVVEIDARTCTGCGICAQICPWTAVRMEKRDGLLSLAVVDEMRCVGCGNCVVDCPVKAISLPVWGDPVILAQIYAALHPSAASANTDGTARTAPRLIAFACEWSAYAAADMAGVYRMPYSPDVRVIQLSCAARFDPYHVLWAFINGADGVFLGACLQGECHHGNGNQYAEKRVKVLKRQLSQHGIDSRRLRLEFFNADDGNAFAKSMNEFSSETDKLRAS